MYTFYKWAPATMTIGLNDLDNSGVYIREKTAFSGSRQHNLYHEYTLKKGQYVAEVQISYKKELEKDFDVTFAIYSEH